MIIYVYGTGCGAGDLVDSALPIEKVEGFIESKPECETFMGKPVLSPEETAERDYDLVIVTSRAADAIEKRCMQAGMDREKFFFLKNSWEIRDRSRAIQAAKEALGEEYLARIRRKNRVIQTISDGRTDLFLEEDYENDYVRIKTLELIARRLANVPGAVAELGVYRGQFASCMNRLFPERTLYLFDTFEGFDPEELERGFRRGEQVSGQEIRDVSETSKMEVRNVLEVSGQEIDGIQVSPLGAGRHGTNPAKSIPRRTAGEGLEAAHKKTSLDLVREKLTFPERAVFRPGLFPKTAEGVEDHFALVSLDVDLEESTLAGLRYFLPRLSEGGLLLLHDFGNDRLPGVSRAVSRYEEEIGKMLPAVPLCDRNGTLVITGRV